MSQDLGTGTEEAERRPSRPSSEGFGRFPITRSFPIFASPYVPEDFTILANSLGRP